MFLDFISDFSRASRFYSRPPEIASWVRDEAAAIRYDAARRQRVATTLERQNRAWGASQKTLHSIERFRSGALALVTGQQVGLFGGPLFSILKAASAIRLAAEVTRLGHDCVPVFWLATEDHDLAEVNHVTLPVPGGALQKLVTTSQGAQDAPISDVKLGREIEEPLAAAAQLLGESEVSHWLRQSYRPGETLGSGFARLFARMFADFGIVLLDASDAELHQIAAPVYRAAAIGAAEVNHALLERGKALTAAGYHEQVKVTPSWTGLFALCAGRRTPVQRVNGQFKIGDDRLPETELAARVAAEPQNFSANVLLRPVVQDYLLPTIAYVGGPAEVAYFAQAGVVYQELLGRVTPVLPRFSATLVEPRIKRLLDRYGLQPADIFHASEQVRQVLSERSLPPGVESKFEAGEAAITAALNDIRESLARLDPTLVEAAQRAGSKMQYQMRRLRARAARAELRRSADLGRHADELCAALYPRKNLAEREIAGVYYVARYGPTLLEGLLQSASGECHNHQVVYL